MSNLIKTCFILVFFCISLHAITLRESVEEAIVSNPDVIAELKNQEAYRMYVDEERADYLPTLNLDGYAEKSNTYNNADVQGALSDKIEKDGWHMILKLEQTLYDGGLSQSQVREREFNYQSNKMRSNYKIEKDVIYEITQTYTDLVMYDELLSLSQAIIKSHEENLVTAKEKEEISGEVLETYQVSSKLYYTTEKFLEQEESKKNTIATFKKLVGKKPTGKICRPIIDESVIPKTLEEAITYGIRNNYEILQKIEDIKKQREKITQQYAGYLPTLTFELQGTWDNDLELDENGRQDIYHARLNLKWNLFAGGKNYIGTKKEKLFLQQAQKDLELKTDEVAEQISNAYEKYYSTKKRISALEKYSEHNLNILEVYKKEFDAGTRTFVDILNAESEVYTSNTALIQREFELYTNYYSLLLNLSKLSDSILMQKKQICTEPVVKKVSIRKIMNSDQSTTNELDGLLDNSAEIAPTAEENRAMEAQKNKEEKINLDAIYEKAK
ncbi:MAG: TolC family protein [Candidatus Marinarcus sp.]|uniref:TolC family protein n=1 Tax=Candidatus Marinarcus sp. TaxID=3100987 RepID=UPI003B00C6B9